MTAAAYHIVPYTAAHREVVRDLNAAWISHYFTLEERDHRDLGDPETHIIGTGGAIFMAEIDGVAVGTCSLMREPDGSYELAKMAVAETARGLGIGRALALTVIDHARALGIPRLELFTNSVLTPAIALYRSLGFVPAPLDHNGYGRANMRMVLDLPSGTPPSLSSTQSSASPRGA